MQTKTEKNATKCAKRISNKITKPFSETFAGLTCMLQGFRIGFKCNPTLKGIESTRKTA